MQRAVNSNDIALGQHLLEGINTTAANLLLNLGLQGLVIKVQKLLAVEGLETAQDTLTDTADGDGSDNLALEIELVLGCGSNIPLASLDLLVCRHEVADQDQDRHDDVLGHGDDVGASDFCDRDAAIGLVRSIQVDVVGSDTCGDGDLEVLGLGQALGGQVARVEAINVRELLSVKKIMGHTGW